MLTNTFFSFFFFSKNAKYKFGQARNDENNEKGCCMLLAIPISNHENCKIGFDAGSDRSCRYRTHRLGPTVSDTRPQIHAVGHTVTDTRSRTHGLGHTVPPSAAIVRESNLRNSSNLNCGLPKVKARKVACDECLCVANLFANAGS